eukprot:3335426-Prymnesium_polylepis.1
MRPARGGESCGPAKQSDNQAIIQSSNFRQSSNQTIRQSSAQRDVESRVARCARPRRASHRVASRRIVSHRVASPCAVLVHVRDCARHVCAQRLSTCVSARVTCVAPVTCVSARVTCVHGTHHVRKCARH